MKVDVPQIQLAIPQGDEAAAAVLLAAAADVGTSAANSSRPELAAAAAAARSEGQMTKVQALMAGSSIAHGRGPSQPESDCHTAIPYRIVWMKEEGPED